MPDSKPRGFIAQKGDYIYYTDGKEVYKAHRTNAVDVTTGFMIGRWECSYAHFRRWCVVCYEISVEELEAAVFTI